MSVGEQTHKFMAVYSREKSVTCLGENIVFTVFIS